MVAHPLQVIRHVVEGQQEAQVARDRLLGGDRPRDERRGEPLRLVQAAVAGDDLERQVGIVVARGPRPRADLVRDHAAQPQHVVLDLALLAIEGVPGTLVGGGGGSARLPPSLTCRRPERSASLVSVMASRRPHPKRPET